MDVVKVIVDFPEDCKTTSEKWEWINMVTDNSDFKPYFSNKDLFQRSINRGFKCIIFNSHASSSLVMTVSGMDSDEFLRTYVNPILDLKDIYG